MLKQPHYHVYVLRFWKEGGESAALPTWRFMIEDPHTGERKGFGSLEALAAFLQEEVSGPETLE